MANDGNGDNNIDPLRQYLLSPENNPPPRSLLPLPENDDVTIPMTMTPTEFKNRLIYGPSPRSQRDSSLLIDALPQNHPSPSSSSSTTLFSESLDDFFLPPPEPNEPVKLHRSRTAPAIARINDYKTEQTVSKSIVKQGVAFKKKGVAFLILYLSLGVLIYYLNRDHYVVNETHPVVDGLYFCIVTMCTIGYGDITPDSVTTKLFSILFVLVGFGFIDLLLTGMITYVLDLQENYVLEAEAATNERFRERMRIRLKVGLSLGVVVLCLGFGVLIMHFVEKIDWLDSVYISVMSVTTVGYGDSAFKTLPGRLIAAVWLLVSILAVAQAFLYLAEARVDKRNRERAKRDRHVLHTNMSVSDFFAADIDHNGCVSKAEYVLYILKKTEKIKDKDMSFIGHQFDKLDRSNTGRITLMDLGK